MEEYIEVDDETGEESVRQRPKLAIPELKFKSITLRDAETERQFLLMLKQSGIPISDHTILESVDIEFSKEVEAISEEKADKVLAQQEFQKKLIGVLQDRGLPLTPELLLTIAQQSTPVAPEMAPQASVGSGQDITTPVNTPDIAADPNGAAAAQANAQTLPVQPGMEQAPPPAPPPPGPPPMTPQLGGNSLLPSNQIMQQPEISSQQAPGMPRRSKSSMRHDPSVIGMRNKLTPETVDRLIKERPWTRSLKPKK